MADALPIYALYALLFADHGLSSGQISLLFAIWSAVSILAEVPTGALADRYSRRNALVAAGILQGAGYACWIGRPGLPAFAAGFVLWGLGGSLVSGALQALVYDGLAAVGAESQYPRVLGRITAAGLLAQLPSALAAVALFAIGGYALVAWVSVGCCLAAAGLASRLPEPPRILDADDAPNLMATLYRGFVLIRRRPGVAPVVVAVAVLTAVDGLEEYFPLLARDWGVPTGINPLATLAIPLVGAAGAALGGRAGVQGRPGTLAVLLGGGALLLGLAGLIAQPVGLVAVALFYGAYRLVLVYADAKLQDGIESSSRATVSSIAGLAAEVSVFGLYAAWTFGGVLLIAAAILVLAAGLPRLLR
ncbi:MAG: Permease, MFS-type [Frankiales bacterium]|nr:Permease, MFS-type [Frankiales bacterium]MDQ1690145.1 hypothetical protein [Pseudonocardiales bacterium]